MTSTCPLGRRPVALALFVLLALGGCALPSEPIPAVFASGGWSRAYEVSQQDVLEQLNTWEQVASKAAVAAVYDMAGATYRFTRRPGWTSVTLNGQTVTDRPVGSEADPVVVWQRDLVDGERHPDRVICARSGCTDVSAWYALADFTDELSLPDEVNMVAPWEAATPLNEVELAAVRWDWARTHILESYEASIIDGTSVTEITEKDRVYYLGKARFAGVETNCIGWLQRREEFADRESRAPWFCFHPSGVLAADNYNTLLEVTALRAAEPGGPGPSTELLDNASRDARMAVLYFADVEESWARRHRLLR